MMRSFIGLFHFNVVLSLFFSLATALPPPRAIQPRTTPSPPAPSAASIIVTITLTSTEKSGESSSSSGGGATPARTTTDIFLELRQDPATTTTAVVASLVLPSGFSSARTFQEKWYQTTYWSCVTEAVQTHCGWHEPVLPGGDNSIAGAVLERRPRPLVAAGAAILAAALAALGWGGWAWAL